VKVRDLNLPYLCSQGPKNIDGFHDPPFDLAPDVLEVEACRHADHAASDVVLEVTGEVFGGPIGGEGVFGVVASENI
jgi:Golgi nucleoside diphosphatase